MKESYRKGVASRPGPESCAASREAAVEALTGGSAGRVWSWEIIATGVPTSFSMAEGNTNGCANASTRRTPRPEVQHARRWGVGRLRNTNEVLEQRRATAGGGHGGKATGQGEHRAGDRAPDTEPDQRGERLA